MSSLERQTVIVRSVVLLKYLQAAGYFLDETGSESAKLNYHTSTQGKLTSDEMTIAELLFHFQTGIQYNLHAVYQVRAYSFLKSIHHAKIGLFIIGVFKRTRAWQTYPFDRYWFWLLSNNNLFQPFLLT